MLKDIYYKLIEINLRIKRNKFIKNKRREFIRLLSIHMDEIGIPARARGIDVIMKEHREYVSKKFINQSPIGV